MPSTEEQTYREGVHEKLELILKQTTATNGKVRKIIVALVLLSGIVIGMNFNNAHDIIQLLAHGI